MEYIIARYQKENASHALFWKKRIVKRRREKWFVFTQSCVKLGDR